MLTYFIFVIGTILIATFSIHDRLKRIQRTQLYHTQWIQDVMLKVADPASYRSSFKEGGDAPKDLNPTMVVPYLPVMSRSQNERFLQWVLAKEHEPFTAEEVRQLEKALAEREVK